MSSTQMLIVYAVPLLACLGMLIPLLYACVLDGRYNAAVNGGVARNRVNRHRSNAAAPVRVRVARQTRFATAPSLA